MRKFCALLLDHKRMNMKILLAFPHPILSISHTHGSVGALNAFIYLKKVHLIYFFQSLELN